MRKLKPSKLTDLANQHSALQLGILTRASVDWLKANVVKLRTARSISNGIIQEPGRPISKLEKGKLYFFKYDPKHKDTLPYYDIFPLVLILEKYDDGFLGLNLHYLPIKMRAAFLDQLLQKGKYAGEDGVEKFGGRYTGAGDIRKIQITYEILNNVSRLKAFAPCLKRYLSKGEYMKSPLLQIHPHEWPTAVFLPVEQFKKANKTKVQADSLSAIKERSKQNV
jgi:hypothetical protein